MCSALPTFEIFVELEIHHAFTMDAAIHEELGKRQLFRAEIFNHGRSDNDLLIQLAQVFEEHCHIQDYTL